MTIKPQRCPVCDFPLIWTWDGRLVCPVLGCDGDTTSLTPTGEAQGPSTATGIGGDGPTKGTNP